MHGSRNVTHTPKHVGEMCITYKCVFVWNIEEVFNTEVVYMHIRLTANGILKHFLKKEKKNS